MIQPRRKVENNGFFRISDVAEMIGVSPSTLRMWEEIGLVTPQRSAGGRYRLYNLDDIELLKKIKHLKVAKHLNSEGVLHILQSENSENQVNSGLTEKSLTKSIGQKLRELRLQQNLTLEEVATQTELSVSFLSLLERSQTNASVATLQKLASFYKTNVLSFFDEAQEAKKLIRATERKVLETQSGTLIELLAAGQTAMEPHLFSIKPGTTSGGAYSHEGEEFVFVIKGRFEIWLDEIEHYTLNKGDSLYFSSSQTHRWLNPGKTETCLIWINTPPTF